MYMRQINIHGFKSFGPEQRKGILEDLHPGLNIIVGAKNAGKTNVIYAAEFLLTNQLAMTNEEIRKSLLFRIGRTQQQNGTVHIKFDYQQEALPPIRSMTRKISRKSDILQVNGQLMNRIQTSRILYAAGLDLKSWFYIVKHGKVNLMSSTKEDYRLDEILRTFESENYDEERRRLQMTLRRNRNALQRTTDLLNEYERQLDKYKPLKKALEVYSTLEVTRRAVEYCIREIQLNEIKQLLKKDHESSISIKENVKTLKEHPNLFKERILKFEKTMDKKHKKLEHEIMIIKQLVALQKLIENEKEILFTAEHQKDIIFIKKEMLEEEMNRYSVDLACCKQHITDHHQQYNDYEQQEVDCAKRLLLNSSREEILLAKHFARNISFEEKKHFYDNTVMQYEDNIQQSRERIEKLEAQLIQLSNEKQQNKQEIKSYLELQRNLKVKYDHVSTRLPILQERCAMEEYKLRQENATSQPWMELTEFEFGLKMKEVKQLYCFYSQNIFPSISTEKLPELLKKWLYTTGLHNAEIDGLIEVINEILDGFWSALELKEKIRNQSPHLLTYWYGSILEGIMDVPKHLYGAVESAAGIRLFYQIVKSVEIAEILKEKLKENNFKGVIKFLILDNLKDSVPEYPCCEDVYPLSKMLINQNSIINKAIKYAFGNVLCCKTEVMMLFAHQGYTCVSPKGTKVADKHGLRYIDRSVSSIQVFKDLEDFRGHMRAQGPHKQHECIDISELLEVKSSLRDIKSQMECQSSEIRKALTQLETVNSLEERKKERLSKNKNILQHQKLKKRMMMQHLRQEEASVEDSELKDQLTQLVKERLSANAEMKAVLTSLMELNYYKDKIKSEKIEIQCLKYEQQKGDIMLELKILENCITEARICCNSLELSYVKLKNTLYNIMTEGEDEMEQEQDYILEDIEKQEQQEKEKNLQKLKLQQFKIQLRKHCLQEMKNGLEEVEEIQHSNFEDILNTLKDKNFEDLKEMLKEVNQQIKTCGITAVDVRNYSYIHESWENANKRLKKLQNGITAAQRMLKEKDRNKIPLLRRTFKAISEKFRSVFCRFVPDGSANIVFKERKVTSEEQDREPDLSERFFAEITATFSGHVQEPQAMELLAENEKTLLGLVLILALQMVFRVPFCIFDDVELMLQPEYRPPFYDLIIEMAKTCQVLIVTKSRKLIQHADRCYVIRNVKGVSQVHIASSAGALQHIP